MLMEKYYQQHLKVTIYGITDSTVIRSLPNSIGNNQQIWFIIVEKLNDKYDTKITNNNTKNKIPTTVEMQQASLAQKMFTFEDGMVGNTSELGIDQYCEGNR